MNGERFKLLRGVSAAPFILFVLALGALTVFQRGREFVRLDCRAGLFLREMIEGGPSFFPVLYGSPYPDYTAAQTFLSWLLFHVTGRADMLTAVFPAAAAGALTAALLWVEARRISRDFAVCSVCMLFLTYGFMWFCRSPLPDVFVMSAAFGAWMAARRFGEGSKPFLWAAVIVLAELAGFVFRGPLGLVIPAGCVFAHLASGLRWRGAVVTGVLALAALAACLAGLWLCARAQGGAQLAAEVMEAQIHGRMGGGGGRPFYYYLINAPAIYALSAPLALAALAVNWRTLKAFKTETEISLLRSLLACCAVIIIGMSVPGTKHIRYILPLAPFAAMAAAFVITNHSDNRFCHIVSRVLGVTFRLVPPLLLAAALLSLPFVRRLSPGLLMPFCVFAAVALSVLLIDILSSPKRGAAPRSPAQSMLSGALVFVCLNLLVIEPVRDSLGGSRLFAAEAEMARAGRPLFFYQMGPDGDDLKYLVNVPGKVPASYAFSAEDIKTAPADAVFVGGEKDFAALPGELKKRLQIIAKGRVSAKPYFALIVQRDAPDGK